MTRSPRCLAWLFPVALCALAVGPRATAQETPRSTPGAGPKIVFIHGGPSHGRGEHEYRAGCQLIKDALTQAVPGLRSELHLNWPADEKTFDDANSVVIFSSGGGAHPLLPHLESFGKVMDRGVGLVCLHYAVEIPKGDPGDALLGWLGGYFETHWSVNPHWEAEFTVASDHAITRGVDKLVANDEWYYHMRFQKDPEGMTPILTAVPPESTLSRPDGPHSGNPAVRKEVAERVPQTVAWAHERVDGGRAFGFTGLHFHRNFANDAYRKLVLNGVLWTTGTDIPKGGIDSPTPTKQALESNLDRP